MTFRCGAAHAHLGAGVSLARLLWHVPVPAMLTLIASLLLERRVLVVGQSRDMVSAAVNAAQALLHPFRCVVDTHQVLSLPHQDTARIACRTP